MNGTLLTLLIFTNVVWYLIFRVNKKMIVSYTNIILELTHKLGGEAVRILSNKHKTG